MFGHLIFITLRSLSCHCFLSILNLPRSLIRCLRSHWAVFKGSSNVGSHEPCSRLLLSGWLLLSPAEKRADQSASSSGGKGMWGGRRCMTSYFCCLLLSLLTGKSVSPTAGGETGACGDSDWWCTYLVINFSYQLCCGASICNIYPT